MSLSYAEFDAQVNRFARYLVSVGVGPGRWWVLRFVGRLICWLRFTVCSGLVVGMFRWIGSACRA
ncbi:hypothetical protein ACETU7_34365 [Rhodococcus sp. 3Y1]